MTEIEAVIAALRLEKEQLQAQCQGEPYNMMALDYIERLIDRLAEKSPDEHTAYAEAMVRVVACAILYESADRLFKRTDQTKSDYAYTRRGRAQAHNDLMVAIREMRRTPE